MLLRISGNFEFQVKRLNVDIPFILDALEASETIEVQVQYISSH